MSSEIKTWRNLSNTFCYTLVAELSGEAANGIEDQITTFFVYTQGYVGLSAGICKGYLGEHCRVKLKIPALDHVRDHIRGYLNLGQSVPTQTWSMRWIISLTLSRTTIASSLTISAILKNGRNWSRWRCWLNFSLLRYLPNAARSLGESSNLQRILPESISVSTN